MTDVETKEAAIEVSVDEVGYILGSAERPVVVVERTLRATPADVWSAWTDPERARRWLGALEAPLGELGRPIRMAMTATELPADLDDAEFLATLTVLESVPPSGDGEGRLVFTFDDQSDPGGQVTVTMTPVGTDRCHLRLRHALRPVDGALTQAAGFGAGWDGFLDWLEDALDGRDHGPDERYEVLLPHYEARMRRLSEVVAGSREDADSRSTVRHRRVVEASPQHVWELLTTPAGLGRWLADVVEGTFGPDQHVVLVHDENAPETSRQDSVVTVWDPPHRLVLTWDFSGETQSVVEFTLTPGGSHTVIELVHRDLADLVDDYLAGWHAHLDLLVAEAEGWGRPPWSEAFAAARLVYARTESIIGTVGS